MPTLTLPDELKPGATQIVLLSDEVFADLTVQLEKAPLAFSPEELAGAIAEHVKGISEDDLGELLETSVFLYSVRDGAGVALPDFIDDVTAGIADDEDLAIGLSSLTPQKLKDRLSVLLNNKAVAFTSKARLKQKAHEKTLCTAQILTDVRPIFGANGGSAPVAAFPIHTLNISYHHGRILKEFFVALDADDLDILEDLIDQARIEAGQLKAILNLAEVACPEDE